MASLTSDTMNNFFNLTVRFTNEWRGVAMGSPFGSLQDNKSMCSIEEKVEEKNKLPSFYKRYVDDTLCPTSWNGIGKTFR